MLDTPTLVTDGGAGGGYHRQLNPVIFRHLSAIVTSFSLSGFYLLIYLTDIAGGPFGGVLSPLESPRRWPRMTLVSGCNFAHVSDAHISRGLGGRGLIAPSPRQPHVLARLWKEERGKIYVS